MKKKLISLLSLIMLITFTYIPVYVQSAGNVQFIEGYEDGTFRPDNNLTRAEAAKIISQLISDGGKKDTDFRDVSKDAWYYHSIAKLNDKDMLHSYKDYFEPDKPITRIEFAEFIYIYKNGYSPDETREDMFTGLASEGIIKGYDDGSFRREGNITRAEATALINRVVKNEVSAESGYLKFKDVGKDYWAYNDIYAALKRGLGITIDKNVTYPIAPPADLDTKVFDKYNERGDGWRGLHIINDDLRAKGLTIGGEGGQRMNGMAISADGSFMLIGHDTYPVHKSTDFGKTWHDANRGLGAAGASFAIDPNNNKRALCYGTGQGFSFGPHTGLYLTEDQATTWKQVLSQTYANTQNEFRDSVCWDPSSYDETIGGSSVAYWSKNYRYGGFGRVLTDDKIVREPAVEGEKEGLFKSTDGGNTWFVVNPDMSDAVVKVHPETGVVYCGNLDGFFRSEDGGVTFEQILGGSIIYSLDVILTHPDNVYVNDYKGVCISEDSGKTFRRVESKNFPESKDKDIPGQSVRNLKVSPLNPNKMVVCNETTFGSDHNFKYYSKDGGVTWNQSKINQGNALFPVNDREGTFVWDPTDENIVWTFGGDYLVRSIDGGANYEYYQDGSEGIAYTGGIVFNLYDPDLVYLGAQDFHGATTNDGGESWEYINNVAGSKWFGCVYGAYRADENTLIACASTKGWKSPCTIKVSRDAGKSWTDTGVVPLHGGKNYDQMCYQSPTDFNVLFAGHCRSTDFGYTWEEMDVDFVSTHNPYGKKELYGVKGAEVKVSYDDGATWKTVYTAPDAEEKPGVVWDVAYDGINDILYVVDGRAAVGMELHKIQNGVVTNLRDRLSVNGDRPSLHWVCVDPRYPDIIYTGGYKMYPNTLGVLRSVDGGETFQILSTVDAVNTIASEDGETCAGLPVSMEVNPVTGELWVSESCENINVFPPPYEN